MDANPLPPSRHEPPQTANPAPTHPTPPAKYSWVFVVALLISLGLVAFGAYAASTGKGWSLLATGSGCAVVTLLGWALAATASAEAERGRRQLQESLAPLHERFEQFSVMLNLISEQQLLSDRGKSIAYRNKDREALRFAIQEEINRGDYEAALKLAAEMDASFGSRAEAEQFRKIIEDRRTDVVRRHLAEALQQIDRAVRAEQWALASREAEAVAARFPEEPQARNLPAEVEARRQGHKKQLLESFQDAVNRHDVDAAMVLMRQLDAYLTPSEAESLQETARSIVKAKLEALREQFSRAVHEGRWTEALRIGDVITSDFPNSTMAKEVREVSETLRQRAAQPAGA